MKLTSKLAFLVLAVVVWMPHAARAADPAKPNVVFIITDDCGYSDFGFQGAKDIKTPNIDALAKQSVRFTNAYVTAPICSASRAGLITDRYQQRHSFDASTPPGGGVSMNEALISEVLKKSGYTTGMFGKWSLGDTVQFNPANRGFDQFFGFTGQLHPYIPGPVTRGMEMVMTEAPRQLTDLDGTQIWGPPAAGRGGGGGLISGAGPGSQAGKILRGLTEVEEPEHLTDAFTREALAFLKAKHDGPFFLYLSYNASHSPLQPPQKYIDQYPSLTGKRQLYAATTTHMDESIGQVLTTIRDLKLEENTLILFINDNGGARDDIAADNAPLSGSKFQLWEGGIRVPFFVHWKGHIAEGVTLDQPVISLDIFPTVLAATGLQAPAGKELEGINLMPVLSSGKNDAAQMERVLYWRYNNFTAIRKGKWKLTTPQGQVTSPQLFDLSTDVAERKDLAGGNPTVVKELTDLWTTWNAKNIPVGAGRGIAGAGRAGAGAGAGGGRAGRAGGAGRGGAAEATPALEGN